jgi:hypothetical protein
VRETYGWMIVDALSCQQRVASSVGEDDSRLDPETDRIFSTSARRYRMQKNRLHNGTYP